MASLELKLQGKFFHKPIAFEFYLGYWEGTPKPGSSLGPQVLFPLCFGIGLSQSNAEKRCGVCEHGRSVT